RKKSLKPSEHVLELSGNEEYADNAGYHDHRRSLSYDTYASASPVTTLRSAAGCCWPCVSSLRPDAIALPFQGGWFIWGSRDPRRRRRWVPGWGYRYVPMA
ncbi:MAG: hypothetical protein FWD31_15210, partial [Planctomycetaceae bacterium]|nr:hypothetical protein [Planctomycetaceae bacterium]